MTQRVMRIWWVVVVVLAAAGCGGEQRLSEEERAEVEAEFAGEVAAAIAGAVAEIEGAEGEAVAAFYARREHRPVWLGATGPTARGRELAVALLGAGAHGLEVTDYGGERLALAVAELTRAEAREDDEAYAARAARLDPALTAAFLHMAYDLARGRVEPEEAGIHWESEPREIDLGRVLTVAAEQGPEAALAAARPPHEQYALLEKALGGYRRAVAAGGWPEVPPGEALEPGDQDPQRVVALRRRLAAEGYAVAAAPAGGEGGEEGQGGETQAPDGRPGEPGAAADPLSPVYDEALAAAVREYQRRRGLEPDGVVGGKTLDELNVSAVDRVRQIEANLERWRWMPADLGERYVLVNVPRFELHAVEDGREVLRMKVVVGEELNATPMFSDRMQYVVFNPYWNVPASIVREEILPAVRRNPGYLAANHMEVVRGWEGGQVLGSWAGAGAVAQAAESGSGLRVRQRPGPANPLGQIKFLFPNEHAIYLHDTSAGHLFDETVRLFSHGCIRIEKPVELASWALGWPEARVRAAAAPGDADDWESLPEEIPVHILYYTVAVDEDGSVLFFDDFYGIDRRVLAAIDEHPAEGLPLVEAQTADG